MNDDKEHAFTLYVTLVNMNLVEVGNNVYFANMIYFLIK